MAVREKACQLSFQSPNCTDDRFTLPHNFIYDIPLQSRGITKELDLLGPFPIFKSMGLVSDMMMPFCEPTDFNFESVRKDPLQNILREKREFLIQLKSRLSVITGGNSHGRNSTVRILKHGTPITNASSSNTNFLVSEPPFIKLTEWIERDPYPYLSGSHLWFAVGGCINHVSLGDQTAVIAPDGRNFDKIKIISLNSRNRRNCDIPSWTMECTPGDRIFQVVTSKSKKRALIAARTLRGFHLFRMKRDDGGLPKCRKLIDVSEPDNVLVCIDVSSRDGATVCTLDKFNSVKIYDVSAGKCVCDAKIRVRANRAAEPEARFIQYSDQPSVVYVTNKRKLYLKDIREPFDSSGTTFNVYDAQNGCEELSVTASSALGGLLYCSSSHHSFALDPRKGWLKRWSHGVDEVPLYLNTGITESLKELVVTGNLEVGTVTGIIQEWKQAGDDIVVSACSSPTLLPSVIDTALWANSKGFWLEPSIGKRVESSLCGMTIVPFTSGSGCTLFTVNAVGDVFSMHLIPDEDADTDSFNVHKTSRVTGNGLHVAEEWEKGHMEHLRTSTSELECASLEDRFYLCSMIKHHLNVDATARSKLVKWRRSFKQVHAPPTSHRVSKLRPFRESRLADLSAHKDWLVHDILSVWDMGVLGDEARANEPVLFKKPPKRALKRKAAAMSSDDSSSDTE